MQRAVLTEVPTASAAAINRLWYAAIRNPLIKPHSSMALNVGALMAAHRREPVPRPQVKYSWKGAPKP